MFHQAIVLSTNANSLTLSEIAQSLEQILPAEFLITENNPDIKEIKRQKNSIGIAEILPLISWNAQKPFQGEHKLGVIYEAERLTPEAQNSLLKTLEEPSPGTLICLVTRNRSSLLPTILSRSRIVIAEKSYAPSTAEESESTRLSVEFLKGDLLEKSQVIGQIADSDDNREIAVNFVADLMKQLVQNPGNLTLELQNQYLDICKFAYQGLKSGTNIKLTLETIVISMS